MDCHDWSVGLGTSLGPMAGTDPTEAHRMILGELNLPHIVQLPDRGLGADACGRTAGLLSGLSVDMSTTGYRLSRGTSRVQRIIDSFLFQDLDSFEEVWESAGYKKQWSISHDSEENSSAKYMKTQAMGPISLAAELELPNGRRVLQDHGAFRDLTESLAEGMQQHCRDLSRRFHCRVVVQLDEPHVEAAISGTLSGRTQFEKVAALSLTAAVSAIDTVVAAITEQGSKNNIVWVESDYGDSSWRIAKESQAHVFGVPKTLNSVVHLDQLAQVWDSGKIFALHVIPVTEADDSISAGELVNRIMNWAQRIGFSREFVAHNSIITPESSLVNSSIRSARRAMGLSTQVAEVVREFG